MRTIFKYPLRATDRQLLSLPRGAEILCLQTQEGVPCVWALVDSMEPAKVEHLLVTYGTGHHAPNADAGEYVGTYQLQGGALVFHVFDEGRPQPSSTKEK